MSYPTPLQIDLNCVPIVSQMMVNGIRLDLDHFRDMSKRYQKRLKELQIEIDEECKHHLNPSSSTQVLQWMEVNNVRDREGKKPKHSATKTIAPIAIDYPVLQKVREYRKLHKLLGTYVSKFPELVDKEDRLHTNYSITTTDTYRLSSYDVNLQNVSKKTKEGNEVRRGFIPSEGHTFVGRDYSAQELRWLANLSGDSTMLNTYLSGGDLHTETEKAIFGTDDGSNRNPSKSINFGEIAPK
jgi:DNA polymerase-1